MCYKEFKAAFRDATPNNQPFDGAIKEVSFTSAGDLGRDFQAGPKCSVQVKANGRAVADTPGGRFAVKTEKAAILRCWHWYKKHGGGLIPRMAPGGIGPRLGQKFAGGPAGAKRRLANKSSDVRDLLARYGFQAVDDAIITGDSLEFEFECGTGSHFCKVRNPFSRQAVARQIITGCDRKITRVLGIKTHPVFEAVFGPLEAKYYSLDGRLLVNHEHFLTEDEQVSLRNWLGELGGKYRC